MATVAASTTTITTLQHPLFFFFSSSSSSPSPHLISFPARRTRRRSGAVVVGVRKYKGTAMREEKLAEMIEKKVAEAIQVCQDDDDDGDGTGCRVAWDEVEEVSQAKADLRRKMADSSAADPLQHFCDDNPETDECRIYGD